MGGDIELTPLPAVEQAMAPNQRGLLKQDADVAAPLARKELQNRTFRSGGLAVLALGAVGFAPSITKALLTGSLWSVSHDAKHTDNDFLGVHTVGAVVWILAAAAQLWTGGVSKYTTVHRICGYCGSTGLFVAMVFATANELKYATPESALGNFYTLLLAIGATVNMIVGIVRARQRRFAEHKDSMLLALMFTLDPAVHRLAMWTIRLVLGGGKINALQLLILGKMPANFVLYVVFGWMFVHGRRVNRATVLCTSFNLIAFIGGATLAFAGAADGTVAPTVWRLALAGTIAMLAITAMFVVIEKRKRFRESK